jgi:hypothetical protein
VTVAVDEKLEQLHREHEWGITEASDDAESVQPAVSSRAGREALSEGVRYAYDGQTAKSGFRINGLVGASNDSVTQFVSACTSKIKPCFQEPKLEEGREKKKCM